MPLIQPTRHQAPRDAALDSSDAALRRLAVADCDEAGPLLAQLDLEADAGVRHAILTRLGALAEEGIEAQLVGLLGSEDVALRSDAILALRRRGEAALPALASSLSSPNPDLRIFAANVLEGIASSGARAALTALLSREVDVSVCLAVVEALAQIGTPEDVAAIAALRDKFQDEPCLGFAISLALDQIGSGA